MFFKLILVFINYQQRNIFHSGKKKQNKGNKVKKKTTKKKKESKEQIKTYLLKPFKPKKKPCNYQLRIHTLHQDIFSPNMREPITLLMLC